MREENEQTKLLWEELKKDNPSEETIRQLVKDGANITGAFFKDSIFIMMPSRDDAGNFYGKLPDFKIFQLLLELGGELNFEEEGFNCLFDACLSWNKELVEFLLKAGANPNCISEDRESMLSWVKFDRHHEGEDSPGWKYIGEIMD